MCLAYTPPSSSDNEHVKSDQSVLRLSCIKLAPWLLSRQVSNAHLTSPSAISLDLASSTQWPQRRRGFDGSLGLPLRVICAPGTGIDRQTISNWPIWSDLTCPMSLLDPFTYVADWSGVLFFFSNVIPWRMLQTTWYKVPPPFEPFSTKIAIWLGEPRYSTV